MLKVSFPLKVTILAACGIAGLASKRSARAARILVRIAGSCRISGQRNGDVCRAFVREVLNLAGCSSLTVRDAYRARRMEITLLHCRATTTDDRHGNREAVILVGPLLV